jgi:hypothetical protein
MQNPNQVHDAAVPMTDDADFLSMHIVLFFFFFGPYNDRMIFLHLC